MKQITVFLLVLVILAQSVGKLALLSNYLVNRDFITLNYCENKNKPKLHCNGKCHLSKQLKEQEKQEGSSKNNTKSIDETQFCSEYVHAISPRVVYISISENWSYINRETDNTSPSIFHPPTV